MNEEKKSASGKGGLGGIVFLLAGFILASIVGWVVFPKVLYSQKTQPINFSHAAHQDNACEDCHYFKEDGTYSGTGQTESCAECHESAMTDSEDEAILISEYIEKEKPIPWLTYAWQPDNVYFSHAPHQKEGIECVRCHRDVSSETKLPVYSENRLTGYSKSTMKMIECEKCHAEQKASNACQMCHK